MSKTTFLGAITLLFSLHTVYAQGVPVPPEFQATNTDVNANIANFKKTVNAAWDGSPYPVLRSAVLQSAISDLTSSLLAPNYYQVAVLSELNSLQALGVTAITIPINFPVMYPGYYSDSAEYQSYADFYTQLSNEIRSRGLKLIVENTSSSPYPGTNSADFVPYYQSLNWTTYQQQRAQLAANIAQVLQPDYLVLLEEPDTEAMVTGQTTVNTVAGATQMLQGMITAVQGTGKTSIKLSAGCGTWHPSFLQFIQSFANLSIPLIDMHVYPVNKNNLPNALSAVNIIKAAGKTPSMSEMWAYKESDAEYVNNLPYTTVFARDVYSFWGPADVNFLQAMNDFTTYGHFAFSSPFWSHYFSAYLDYNTYKGSSDETVIAAAGNASGQAALVGAFTPTGLSYENMNTGSPDQTAPLVPAAPAVQGYSQIAATLAWTPTTDDVGVAAYNIYRDNVLVGTVSSPLIFSDSGLSPSTTYNYTIAAFDATGNLSPVSAPFAVTTRATPDRTAPATPAAVQAAPFSDTQVSLAWNASTDNVAVAGYVVYRGTTAANLTPIAQVAANSFLDLNGAPSKTYYYQVDAYDSVGNHSPRSAIVSGTTLPDTTAPTSPSNISLSTSAGPKVTVTWASSTDDYYLASYQIFRGTTPSNGVLIGGVAATAQTFTDTHASSGKTYYYSVAAVDLATNVSAIRPAVSILAFPDATPPNGPTRLQAVAISDTQMSLTWNASTDNIAVYGYEIYRGTSPSAITPLGFVTNTSFVDTTVSPNKTYYYQVDAYDAANNHSVRSSTVTATSLADTVAPSTPVALSAAAVAGPGSTLSWPASTDDYWVGSYQIYRGTTSSNLTLFAQQSATSLTYTDTRVVSGRTYYYSVVAVDVAGNLSGFSPQATVTQP